MIKRKSFPLVDIVIRYSGYLAFLLVAILFALKSTVFLKPQNVVNILMQSSVLGMVAFGLTGIFIGGGDDVIRGGTDLSIANNMAFSACIISVLLSKGVPLLLTLIIGLATSCLIGAINALGVVIFKMVPLLSTLSIMFILQGLEKLISGNVVIPVQHPFFVILKETTFLGIPLMVWIFILTAAIMFLIFNISRFGNWISAVGGNEAAAAASGVPTKKVVALTYILAGIPAFLAGVLLLSRLSAFSPGQGDLMLFDVMLISYLGAIFSRQYRPNVWGTFISALFIGMITNGFSLINVSSYWIYGIKGLLILITVSITTVRKRKVM